MINSIDQLDLIKNYNNSPQEKSIDNTDFGYKLYAEQKQVLYLMKTLEAQRSIYDNENIIEYNKLCLAAPFSFGKTVVSLALVKLKTTPIERNWHSFFNNEVHKDVKTEVLELHIKRPKYVDTTLIIVSPATFYQWISHIEKANITSLIINTIEDLDNLFVNLINGTLSKFDIVLLVYRKLKPNYPLPYGKSILGWSESTNISLLSVLSVDKLWKRVIIDDFDSINLNHDMLIPARIVWLISTTVNNYRHGTRILYHTSRCYDISAMNHRIMDSIRDPYLSKLSIRSNLRISIPMIKLYCYIFPYGRTVNQILNNLNYPTDVSEKINSGDISGAASILGMSRNCSSLGEFLYLLIHKNKQSYMAHIKLCTYLERVLALINENYHRLVRSDTRTEEELVRLIHVNPITFFKAITKDNEWEDYLVALDAGLEFITTNEYHDIKDYLTECKENAGNFKHILERIKRNMEEGLCGKCYCEPEEDKFILQCCNTMLCKYCMLKTDTNIFIDRCPNCTKKLDKNSFIHMPESISLEDFIGIDYQDAFNKLREFNINDSSSHNIEDIDEDSDLLPKEKALLSILRGTVPTDCTTRTANGLDMISIMESKEIVEKSEDIPNKYIIFTRWPKTSSDLSALLNKREMKNVILKGTNPKNIKKEIDKFHYTPDINILLIPSQDISAGLNLEFATHLIFYHSIRVLNTTAQLVGRAQRMGRKCSLKLISLENQYEISTFHHAE